MRQSFLLLCEHMCVEIVCKVRWILAVMNDGCMSADSDLLITKPCDAFTDIFDIFTRYRHYDIIWLRLL